MAAFTPLESRQRAKIIKVISRFFAFALDMLICIQMQAVGILNSQRKGKELFLFSGCLLVYIEEICILMFSQWTKLILWVSRIRTGERQKWFYVHSMRAECARRNKINLNSSFSFKSRFFFLFLTCRFVRKSCPQCKQIRKFSIESSDFHFYEEFHNFESNELIVTLIWCDSLEISHNQQENMITTRVTEVMAFRAKHVIHMCGAYMRDARTQTLPATSTNH